MTEFIGMIFFTMCVSLYSGGENCDYLWTVAPAEQVETMFYSAGGEAISNKTTLWGFVYHPDKKVYMKEGFQPRYIAHEAKHIICYLEFKKLGFNHIDCQGHFEVIR